MSLWGLSMGVHSDFDGRVRLFVYRQLLSRERCPTIAEMAGGLRTSAANVRASLARLSESHAFMMQENGELWRAAPFSCIPTGFPVTVGRKSWFGNCIWDALGIPGHDKERRARRGGLRVLQLRHAGRDTSGGISAQATASFILPFRPGTGTRTSSLPDEPCFCSGRNSMWTAGASNGTALAAARSPWSKAGDWRSSGTAIA